MIINTEGVIKIDDLKTRKFGEKIYIDAEISADADITLHEAHEIAENVHDKVEKNIEQTKHCMIHVNQFYKPNEEDIINETE